MNKRKNCGVGSGTATLGRIALGGLLGTTFLCGTAAPAFAAADDHDVLDVSDLQRVEDGSLDDLRGGFNVGGYDISFGITITTSVNGQQLLQTSFNVNQPGQIGNVVTNYIQQQQQALANGGGNGNAGAGSGGNSAGNIQVEIEVDDDGDIDVDIDSDVDFDELGSPEIAQSFAEFEAAMDAYEDSNGQVAIATSASDDGAGSGANTSLGSAPATAGGTVPQFQQASLAPVAAGDAVAPAQASVQGVPEEDADVDLSGVQTPPPAGNAGSGGPGWNVTQSASGNEWIVQSKDLATTITQQIGDSLSTSIVNSADGIVVEHLTEMNVYLENFAEMQQQAVTSQVMSNLLFDMANQAANGN